MKTVIELCSLTLKNFKGIKDLKIDFKNKVTNIYGDNATGKTTVVDAFTWLLFDKDSTDRKTFEIKTLNQNNEPMHMLEHSVTGEFLINGRKKTMQKIFKEKYTKKRGEAESTFTGHETLYYINDVPMTEANYKKEIAEFVVDETMFKLFTNPLYFSSIMKWDARRQTLMQMNGGIDTDEVISRNPELSELKELLGDEKIENFKLSLASKIKKHNDDLKSIPPRIDECNNAIADVNFAALKGELEEKQKRFNTIEESLISSSKLSEEQDKKFNRVQFLKMKIDKFESDRQAGERVERDRTLSITRDFDSKISNKEYELAEKKRNSDNLDATRKRVVSEIDGIEKERNRQRDLWNQENEKQFVLSQDFTCPTCKRPLEQADIEKKTTALKENFNLEKARVLDNIQARGKSLMAQSEAESKRLKEIEDNTKRLNEEIEALTESVLDLQKQKQDAVEAADKQEVSEYAYPPEYFTVKTELDAINKEIATPSAQSEKVHELLEEKRALQTEMDSIKQTLAKEDNNIKMLSRIQELQKEERRISQEIATLQKQEFLCEQFIRAKVDLLEAEINSKFALVKFKLFSEQINGGLKECCEPMVLGVPFTDINNASKINAGIDIINTLSRFHQFEAPIFVDNRESVNNMIMPHGQLINLYVSHDKSLVIN